MPTEMTHNLVHGAIVGLVALAAVILVLVALNLTAQSKRLKIIAHGLFDLFLLFLLVMFVRSGVARGSIDGLVFWVPFLVITLYFRWKQMRERLGMTSVR